jgi:hypothetical protein
MAEISVQSSKTQKGGTDRKKTVSSKSSADYSQALDSPVKQVLYLQGTIGNRAVTRLFQSGAIQAKLTPGKPNDIYEKEADRVSEQFMRRRDESLVNGHRSLGKQVTPLIQRQEQPEEKEERDQEEKQIQAKPLAEQIKSSVQRQPDEKEKSHSSMGGVSLKVRTGGPGSVVGGVQTIQKSLGVGQPLENRVKSRMGSAFGLDFSSVRIHKDESAVQLSNRMNARAFTIGNDISFAQGEYQPGTPVGDALIAHELAHTVQQNGGSSTGVPMKKGDKEQLALENDADSSAVGAVASIWGGIKGGLENISKTAMPRLRSGLRLSRCGRGGSPPSGPTATARKVQFTGNHALTAYGSDPKINPIWTPGAANHAVAYTKGSAPAINAEFDVGSSFASSSVTSASIRVKEGGNIRGTGTVAIPSGNILSVSGIPLTGLTGSTGIRTSNYNFNWEGSVDGGKTWVPIVMTGPHLVYWLNGPPLTSPLYNFAVSKAAGYSAGATGNAAAVAIRHGPRGVDGLTYDPADAINTDPLSVYADGKGICTDYANLLTLLALSVGIPSNAVMFWGGFQYAGKNIWVTKGGDYLTLTNVNTPVPGYAPTGGWDFNYHAISRIDGVLHDAALDRQDIDAKAIHDGKLIRLIDTATPATLPDAKVGTPYSQTIPRLSHTVAVTIRDYGPKIDTTAFADVIPVHVPMGAASPFDVSVIWAITGGTIPPGLTLNPLTGQITGTPTTSGTFTFNMFVVYGHSTSPLTRGFAAALKVNP